MLAAESGLDRWLLAAARRTAVKIVGTCDTHYLYEDRGNMAFNMRTCDINYKYETSMKIVGTCDINHKY